MALHSSSLRLGVGGVGGVGGIGGVGGVGGVSSVGGVGVAPFYFRRSSLQLRRRAAAFASTVESASRARFVAHRSESSTVQQLQRPLADYMSLPASQYSVLDAQRIERVDDNTFRCYVYSIKFFSFEVCPVLIVRVEEEPYGCCIRLLSCKLEGSPLAEAQNDKFSGVL